MYPSLSQTIRYSLQKLRFLKLNFMLYYTVKYFSASYNISLKVSYIIFYPMTIDFSSYTSKNALLSYALTYWSYLLFFILRDKYPDFFALFFSKSISATCFLLSSSFTEMIITFSSIGYSLELLSTSNLFKFFFFC